jgi:ATP-dependent DNA helicase RecG
MGPILADVLKGIDEGRQCYVVCPAIEDNDQTNIRSVTSIYEGMKKTFKDKVSVGLLHGKMTSDQKEAIMEKFANHEFDILVSTTVVEVGIDVPNATMMVIYDAHRFGLSTIHQLRGRAARGKVQGKCWLLSPSKEEDAIKRLKMLEELKDGFSITEYDLQLRGPGDILGVRQSGLPGFVLGDFAKDQAMMEVCIRDAREILELQQDTEILAYTKNAVEKAQYFD